MLALILALFFVIGIIAGLLSSLFGIGGGILMVPVMYIYLKLIGANPLVMMHVAVGTSLFAMLFTTVNTLFVHYRAGNIMWPAVKMILPFVILGALVGALVSKYLPSTFLRYLFMAFIVWIIIESYRSKHFKQTYQVSDFKGLPPLLTRGLSFFIGLLSVLVGIGGGALMVPFLRHYRLPMKNVVGTTIVPVLFVAVIGSIIYMLIGLHARGLPPYSLGFVNLPAFAGIGLGALIGVPLGVRLAKKLSDRLYARLYLLMLILMLVSMIVA